MSCLHFTEDQVKNVSAWKDARYGFRNTRVSVIIPCVNSCIVHSLKLLCTFSNVVLVRQLQRWCKFQTLVISCYHPLLHIKYFSEAKAHWVCCWLLIKLCNTWTPIYYRQWNICNFLNRLNKNLPKHCFFGWVCACVFLVYHYAENKDLCIYCVSIA